MKPIRRATSLALITAALTAACAPAEDEWSGHPDAAVADDAMVQHALDAPSFAAWWQNHVTSKDAERPTGTPDESVEITYRGEKVVAERYGAALILEGDILVTAKDLATRAAGPLSGTVEKGVAIQGEGFKWPDGVVPYRFGTYNVAAANLSGALTVAQQNDIIDAMEDWEAAVPGLTFRPRTASDTNFVTFNLSTECLSAVGMNPGDSKLSNAGGSPLAGEQIIRYTAGCIASFSRHHEIAHALGVFHEQTRTDQASAGAVQINWQNIIGCPNTASSAADCGSANCGMNPVATCGCPSSPYDANCSKFRNFVTNGDRKDLFGHDFDSVMHYGTDSFNKPGAGDTITVLLNDPATGFPYDVGQRNHLSDRDIATMQALYPTLRIHDVLFARTGTQPLCRFEGRSQDANTNYTVSGLPSAAVQTEEVDTDLLGETDYQVTCDVVSAFWESDYDYPASARTVNPASVSAGKQERYAASMTVRVLNPGLIAVLFK